MLRRGAGSSVAEEQQDLDKRYARKEPVFAKIARWLAAAVKWVKTRKEKSHLAQTLAVLTASVAVVGAGVAVVRAEALADRLRAVEARPVVSVADLEAQAKALQDKVVELSSQALTLGRQVRRLANHAANGDRDVVTKVNDLADDLEAATHDLSALGGRLDQLASDTASTTEMREQARALSDLGDQFSEVAEALQGAVETAQSTADDSMTALAGVAADLSDLSKKVDAVAASLANLGTTVSQQADAIDRAQATADDALAKASASGALNATAIVAPQMNIGDGQTVSRNMPSLPGGSYVIQWWVQDGYGCNGDPIKLLTNAGTVVAQWTTAYGNCNQQTRMQTFTLPAGMHEMALSVGCMPPGNGACVVDVYAVITRSAA